MDQISDLFAFGGGCRGSGRKSPPPVRGCQQGEDNFSYNGGFSLNSGVGGASDHGMPMCTIQWDLPRGTRGGGDDGLGGGDPFTFGRGSGAGQPFATTRTQQGETANGPAPPGPCSLGDPPPIQGGVDYTPGAPRAERTTSAAYSGMEAAIAKWGTGTQELQNHELAWQKPWTGIHQKLKCFRIPREASKN